MAVNRQSLTGSRSQLKHFRVDDVCVCAEDLLLSGVVGYDIGATHIKKNLMH